MAKHSRARPMTVAEINELRAALIENSISLIADADLLYVNGRYARAYALSVLATEEISKLPVLISCLEELAEGIQPNWDHIAKFLTSHPRKLLVNQLYWASQRTPGGLEATSSQQWQEAVKAAEGLHARKLCGFYATSDGGVATTPTKAIGKEEAAFALKLARISVNMLELVSRAFTLRQNDPNAPVKIDFRYSLLDEPCVGK
jgi:AbiV family abortive infection protein